MNIVNPPAAGATITNINGSQITVTLDDPCDIPSVYTVDYEVNYVGCGGGTTNTATATYNFEVPANLLYCDAAETICLTCNGEYLTCV